MSTITKAICWAGSLILLAIGNATGLVDDASATTLFAVLPVLAILSLSGRLHCRLLRGPAL